MSIPIVFLPFLVPVFWGRPWNFLAILYCEMCMLNQLSHFFLFYFLTVIKLYSKDLSDLLFFWFTSNRETALIPIHKHTHIHLQHHSDSFPLEARDRSHHRQHPQQHNRQLMTQFSTGLTWVSTEVSASARWRWSNAKCLPRSILPSKSGDLSSAVGALCDKVMGWFKSIF